MMARNPYAKPNQALGVTDAQWATLKAKITTYLQARADQQTVPDAALRALDAAFADDRVWNQISDETGL